MPSYNYCTVLLKTSLIDPLVPSTPHPPKPLASPPPPTWSRVQLKGSTLLSSPGALQAQAAVPPLLLLLLQLS